jgi:drug/metabolite transporter (DMT)-like permease
VRQHGFSKVFHSKRPGLQVSRALIFLADLLLFATGLRTLPLVEITAITLMFPIFITIFSIPLLGEKVGRFRWLSIVLGFTGVLIILRPGFAVFDIGAIFALSATMLFALYAVLTRKVAQEDSAATCMLYVGVIGMVCSSIVGVFFWQTPDCRLLVLSLC